MSQRVAYHECGYLRRRLPSCLFVILEQGADGVVGDRAIFLLVAHDLASLRSVLNEKTENLPASLFNDVMSAAAAFGLPEQSNEDFLMLSREDAHYLFMGINAVRSGSRLTLQANEAGSDQGLGEALAEEQGGPAVDASAGVDSEPGSQFPSLILGGVRNKPVA